MKAKDADMRFGDNSTLDGSANKGHDILYDGERITLDVINGTSINVLRDAATDVTLTYTFLMQDA